jgi:hypothetical protein
VAALRDLIDAPVPASLRGAHDQAIAAALAALGECAFKAASAAGRRSR